MKKILLVIFVVFILLYTTSCNPLINDVAVAFQSVMQIGGASGTSDSTGLTLTFDVDPTPLTASDITVTGATKGALSGSGTTRTLAISNITVADGDTVSVAIASPAGFIIGGSPKTAVVYKDTRVAVAFQSAEQTGGTSGTVDSTALTLTFDVDPTTLAATDITVTGATKGDLSGSGTTRTLAISDITVGDGETVSVAIASPAGFTISGSPKTAVVYRGRFIGMAYQGGIIAYILQSGDPGYVPGETHGLIAALADHSVTMPWSNGSAISLGTSTSLGSGQANTTAIVTGQGSGSYAAQVCDDYTNADTGTGVYSDWFLPSKDELNKLYLNKTAVGGLNSSYWSSSEDSVSNAWEQYFTSDSINSGKQYSKDKSFNYFIRAVRAF